MKILFTGATGVIGREAVPRLAEAGHDVNAVCRSEKGATWLESVGANPVAVDLFNPAAVHEAVRDREAVIHFATSIPPLMRMRKRGAWAMNDRLRAAATATLVGAASRRGVARFVQQSVTFAYADGGDTWLDEDADIDPPSPVVESALVAERLVEGYTAAGLHGVSLRLSRLYGPGNAAAETIEAVVRRMAPIIGGGGNFVSSLHTADAGSAVVAALDAPAGTYNVSDDVPVSALEYVGTLAHLLDAPAPRHLPRWVARLAAGSVSPLLSVSHRVSNARFKDATGWHPRYQTVVAGWRDVVAEAMTVS